MATIDYSSVYDEYNKAKEYELKKQATMLQKQIDEYNTQRDKINKNYTDAANTTYSDARLSSLGRAENLAAVGLGRGTYDAPSSGYGQSVIAQADSNLRDALSKLNLEKAGKLTDVDNYISQAQADYNANTSGIESDYAQKIAAIQKEQADAQAQYDLQLQQLAASAKSSDPNADLPISASYYDYAKKLYNMKDVKGAYDTIYYALSEIDPNFASSNPTAFKEAMANIVNRMDGSYSNTYQFNNWWYNKNSANSNGWGMNW